ncbi:hypothetical protein PRNP1_008434 [Phytophthora ramorum]
MEILLRRKLKAAQELTKSIMFKEQLKWTKAKQDVEKTMKLNSKHRRELIADMDARLAELDRRWKASEEERLQLLTHHERVVQLQQHAVEVRRSRLAAMKIQMFFRLCLLHKKLQRVEVEKKQYALKLQKELLAKEKLGIETQKRVHKTRTQRGTSNGKPSLEGYKLGGENGHKNSSVAVNNSEFLMRTWK